MREKIVKMTLVDRSSYKYNKGISKRKGDIVNDWRISYEDRNNKEKYGFVFNIYPIIIYEYFGSRLYKRGKFFQ